MRCKKHITDLSSIHGVCASCLRQRLHRVIVAQEQAEVQSSAQNRCNLNSNPNPNPSFPRSVSPYENRQKLDNKRANNKPRLNHSLSDQRFYNSPLIAVNTRGCIGGDSISSNKKKKSLIRFSSFSNLFRSNGSRDGDANSNHRVSVSTSGEPSGAGGKPTSVTSSPLWLSNAGGRQKNKAVNVNEFSNSTTAATGVVRKQRPCVRDRGMSPVRFSDDELSDGSSGYESAESCKRTPKPTPSHPAVRRGGGQNRSVSELIFCLSPLVRASPNRLWNLKGKPPVDGGASGDNRHSAVPHLSNVKSFYANRSRKLADFGRSGPNR